MRIFQVDAFTDRPFTGNPAGVCLLEEPRSERWMRNVAMEMNLSETAFIHQDPDNEEEYHLRWFTPIAEVELCGHATLAGVHILWEQGYLKKDQSAIFHTKSGMLRGRWADGWIELDFPAEPECAVEPPAGLLAALGITNALYVGRNKFDYLVEVESEAVLRGLRPDMSGLGRVEARGVIVTAKGRQYDFVSRFFAPAIGINEDPVTGSAHCCLGPYWQKRLDKEEFTAYQASARGGIIRLHLVEDRVLLAGQAITTLIGDLADGG